MIYINGNALEVKRFPNGESHISIDLLTDVIDVLLKYESDDDLFKLMLVKRYIDSNNYAKSLTYLTIPYFPYERMDRVSNDSEVFTLKYVTEFINSLNFDRVTIHEPHSDVVTALLNNVKTVNTTINLYHNVKRAYDSSSLTLAPDAGAQKRYQCDMIGNKHRNPSTGKIDSFSVTDADKVANAETVYILDDLCSYGGTFLMASQTLKTINPHVKVVLVVAHCEKSILLGELIRSDYVDKIVTTNSIISQEDVDETNYKSKFIIYDINEGEI